MVNMDMFKLEHLTLAELADIEADIKVARKKATTREIARIAAEARKIGYSLSDLIGKKAGQKHVRQQNAR